MTRLLCFIRGHAWERAWTWHVRSGVLVAADYEFCPRCTGWREG